jgi:hypothetical protein
MSQTTPIQYTPSEHTYLQFSITSSLEAVRMKLVDEPGLVLLGPIGPDDMSDEVIAQVSGVPSVDASSSEKVQKAKAFLASLAEVRAEPSVMVFKQRAKRM